MVFNKSHIKNKLLKTHSDSVTITPKHSQLGYHSQNVNYHRF